MDDCDDFMGDVRVVEVHNLIQRVDQSLFHKIDESQTNILKRFDDMESQITTKMNQRCYVQEYMLPKICKISTT